MRRKIEEEEEAIEKKYKRKAEANGNP